MSEISGSAMADENLPGLDPDGNIVLPTTLGQEGPRLSVGYPRHVGQRFSTGPEGESGPTGPPPPPPSPPEDPQDPDNADFFSIRVPSGDWANIRGSYGWNVGGFLREYRRRGGARAGGLLHLKTKDGWAVYHLHDEILESIGDPESYDSEAWGVYPLVPEKPLYLKMKDGSWRKVGALARGGVRVFDFSPTHWLPEFWRPMGYDPFIFFIESDPIFPSTVPPLDEFGQPARWYIRSGTSFFTKPMEAFYWKSSADPANFGSKARSVLTIDVAAIIPYLPPYAETVTFDWSFRGAVYQDATYTTFGERFWLRRLAPIRPAGRFKPFLDNWAGGSTGQTWVNGGFSVGLPGVSMLRYSLDEANTYFGNAIGSEHGGFIHDLKDPRPYHTDDPYLESVTRHKRTMTYAEFLSNSLIVYMLDVTPDTIFPTPSGPTKHGVTAHLSINFDV